MLPKVLDNLKSVNIVAAFQGTHVSPVKHSSAWLPRKCDYQTDRRTNGRTDAGQSDPYVPLHLAGDTKMEGFLVKLFTFFLSKAFVSFEYKHVTEFSSTIRLKCVENMSWNKWIYLQIFEYVVKLFIIRECSSWFSIVGATVTVHQFFCILH